MIDLNNLDKLPPEQRKQFDALLEQFPHLNTKAEHKLQTPTQMENDPGGQLTYAARSETTGLAQDAAINEMDYNFDLTVPERSVDKTEFPTLRVNEETASKYSSLEMPPIVNEQKKLEPIVAPEEEKVPEFSPVGKVHPVLQKMRASLGSRDAVIPVEVKVGVSATE